MADNKEFHILLSGETGAGKSSFIRTISNGLQNPEIGNGVDSMTFNVYRYRVVLNDDIYYFYDVPGFMDAQLRKSNKEIRQEIIEYFLNVDQGKLDGNSFDAILVFESFKSGALSFEKNLKKLTEMFGLSADQLGSSIIVACTKLDVFTEARNAQRLVSLKEMTDKRKSFILKWHNNYNHKTKGLVTVPPETLLAQIDEFLNLMGKVKPVDDVAVRKLHSEIRDLADQYQREYEEETKVVSSSVEVTKAKEYQEEFKVNVEKIDARVKEIEKPVEQIQTFNDKYYESKNVDRTLTFNYQVKETVSRGGLAGMVGFTKTITKNVSHSVKIPETVFEEKVKQTQEKITKVDKDVSVDYVKSFDALTEKRLRFEEILEKESREFELNNADLKALYGNDPQKVKRYFEGKARKVIMKDFQLVNVN